MENKYADFGQKDKMGKKNFIDKCRLYKIY